MGSAPSTSSVKSINLSSEGYQRKKSVADNSCSQSFQDIETIREHQSSSELQRLTAELSLLKEMIKRERQNYLKAEEKTSLLQAKLDSKEEEMLSLRSEIRSLSEQTLQQQDSNMENSLQLRDQYVEKLEEELKQNKEEIAKMSKRYDRKLRKVRELSAKSRQDSALKLFEMKDENVKLAEDNIKLQERLERMSLNSCHDRFGSAGSRRSQSADTSESETEGSDNRTKLILELSEQVAQMDAENIRLKQELKHAMKIVEKVERAKLKALKRAQSQRTEQDSFCVSASSEISEQFNNNMSSSLEAVR